MRAGRLARAWGLGLAGLALAGATAAAPDISGDWWVPAEGADDVDARVSLSRTDNGWVGRIQSLHASRPDVRTGVDARCTACRGEHQGQPLRGLVVVWGLQDKAGRLTGGRILDPDDGEEYTCEIEPAADGQTLRVWAYKGLKLFGHQMVWRRP